MSTPLAERQGLLGSTVRLAQRTYALDYVGFILLQGAFAATKLLIRPAFKQFTLDDRHILHPYSHHERVANWQNLVYAGAAPFVIILVWAIAFRIGFHKGHVALLGLLISVSLTSFLTHCIKNAIGRPRPDLIDRCQPAKGTPYDKFIGIEACTQTNIGMLNDGWRSFPSGHSSFAFSGLGYLSLFLAGQLHVFRPRADLARAVVAFLPSLGALLIALSRVADYRHGPWDVTVGGLLGLAVAIFSYRRYFPSLWSRTCDVPFPSPLDDEKSRRNMKGRDEEEPTRIARAQDFSLESLEEDDEETRPLNEGGGLGSERSESQER